MLTSHTLQIAVPVGIDEFQTNVIVPHHVHDFNNKFRWQGRMGLFLGVVEPPNDRLKM